MEVDEKPRPSCRVALLLGEHAVGRLARFVRVGEGHVVVLLHADLAPRLWRTLPHTHTHTHLHTHIPPGATLLLRTTATH